MPDQGEVWPDKARRDLFFEKLTALLDEFPELKNSLAKDWEDDPLESLPQDGYPGFDPNSPTMYTGMALILSIANLDNYETVMILDPFQQSWYHTIGILDHAAWLNHGAG